MKSIVWLLLVLMNSCLVCISTSLSNITDHSALLAFKSEISYDPNNALSSNWTEATSFCNWVGIQCSRHRQRVTVLRLPGMGLGGTISPHLGNLSFLVSLGLTNNSFRGSLPPELGQLRRLQILRLSYNQLEGKIPVSLQHCQHLQVLSFSRNRLSGVIPVELTNIASLHELYLGANNFVGTLPPSLGNLSNVQWLGLEENNISGSIPNEVVNLQGLIAINLGINNLTGIIPRGIFNISSLQQFILPCNSVSGSLPSIVCLSVPKLEILSVNGNQLTGSIPLDLGNCSRLNELTLQFNFLTGHIPTNLGQLQLLETVSVVGNQLKLDPGSLELSFLTAMTNCSSLRYLLLSNNPLGGILPNSIGNFLKSLQWFGASSCELTCQIPNGIGSLHVNTLELTYNNLYGTIPSTVGSMRGLQRVYLPYNELGGSIPYEICLLNSLGEIYLESNKLHGPIPSCLQNLSRIQEMDLSLNSLTSMPLSLWMLENLLYLSSNSLGGSLEMDMKALKNLDTMDLSWNKFLGSIPSNIGEFQILRYLKMAGNTFSGPIPESFGDAIALEYLDLSHNNLSGTIPKSFEAFLHLEFLNLSFNKLSGEIPSGGPFVNFTAKSFMNNEALCGNQNLQVPPCKSHGTQKSWTKKFLKFIILSSVLLPVILVALLLISKRYFGNRFMNEGQEDVLPLLENTMITYRELCHSTDNLSEANLLGVGSFGSVYKGILSNGETVAVKVLNLQVEGAFKSFDAECKVLRSVRHRNLVKVISTCSNPELRALVLQYMPHGSLEKWLYSHNYCLNLLQRVSIIYDVALALEYLHHGQSEPVVHCDLKPSNVLLDVDMVAHVGDFGIAKVLAEDKTATQTKTLGTIGYIAPEYGSEGRVSAKGDVYNYGIMLLETFTRKKPTDEMFAGELSLTRWVDSSLPERVMEVVDCGLLENLDREVAIAAENYFLAIIELGLECCKELSEERIDIKDVVVKLNKIKLSLFHIQNSWY